MTRARRESGMPVPVCKGWADPRRRGVRGHGSVSPCSRGTPARGRSTGRARRNALRCACMPRIRTLLFVVAITELVLLVALGRVLGGTTMLVWSAVAAVAGWAIAKREGARALRGWQAATAR